MMNYNTRLLCKGLDALEDKLVDEIREMKNVVWPEDYDKEEKEDADREIGYKEGQRDAYIEVRRALEQ